MVVVVLVRVLVRVWVRVRVRVRVRVLVLIPVVLVLVLFVMGEITSGWSSTLLGRRWTFVFYVVSATGRSRARSTY